jgi:hypothetical protein
VLHSCAISAGCACTVARLSTYALLQAQASRQPLQAVHHDSLLLQGTNPAYLHDPSQPLPVHMPEPQLLTTIHVVAALPSQPVNPLRPLRAQPPPPRACQRTHTHPCLSVPPNARPAPAPPPASPPHPPCLSMRLLPGPGCTPCRSPLR